MVAPAIGDGATYSLGSDRYACTVVAVHTSASGRTVTVTVQQDKVHCLAGIQSERQTWQCTPDPNGEKLKFISRDGGAFWRPGSRSRIAFGERNPYRDPCF